MIKTYIIPQLYEIKIDNEISLRLATNSNDLVLEPGSGEAGLGGETNGSGETNWERKETSPPKVGEFQSTEIWQ
jgi:hypothetical protein